MHRLEKIRDAMAGEPKPDNALLDQIRSEIELQTSMSNALRDEGQAARDAAHAWLSRWPQAPLIRRGTMANVLAFGLKSAGEIDAGLEWTVRARLWLSQAEGWYSLSWTEYLTALLHMKRGSYFEARQAAERCLELLHRKLNGHVAHAALIHSILATVAYEFDELEKARTHLDHCFPHVAEDGQADAVLMAYLTAAKVERLDRGEMQGLKKLREGQDLGARRGLPRVTISLAAEECGWHGRAGRFDEARRVAAKHGFEELKDQQNGSTLRSTKAFLVASRYLIRYSAPTVVTMIEEPITRCREKHLYRRWVELLLLKTIALRQKGETTKSVQCFREALEIAAPRGYFRTIQDEMPDLVAVLERMEAADLQGSVAAPLVRRLQQATRDAGAGKQAQGTSSAELVETLSRRELAILKRLESGLRNKEIADSIFISEGTLKWHLHNIYGKMGVKNRSGALAKARALNLL